MCLTTKYFMYKVFLNVGPRRKFNSSDWFLSQSSLKAHNAHVRSHLNPERK